MFIETYIMLGMFAVLLPIALLIAGNRAYQRERFDQRWEQRYEREVEEDDARVEYLDSLYIAD
jgi:hypothetical protein